MVAPRVNPAAQASAPADAVPGGWVDRAPHGMQPYLRLMRLDRPIGTWLLFLPCVFGLASGDIFRGKAFGALHDWAFLVLFAIGALVMRGAGCTYNDIVDRRIDAAVARTRTRPIPSGAVPVGAAIAFLLAQACAGLLVLLQLNRFSIALGFASLALIAVYPFMKRITWWPQAWLGLTFNWGVLLGFAAATAQISGAVFLLYAGCIFWTLGYDTIYAHQDREDDALIGVKSTARLFGARSRIWIAGFYAAAVALIAASVFAGRHVSPLAALLILPAALHLAWQAASLNTNDPARCLRLFRSNRDTGILIAAALVIATHLPA